MLVRALSSDCMVERYSVSLKETCGKRKFSVLEAREFIHVRLHVIPDEELIVPDGEENTIEDDTLREVEDELVTKEESETNVQEHTEETSVCELIEDTNQQAELITIRRTLVTSVVS